MSESHANSDNTQSQTENLHVPDPDYIVGHSGNLDLERPVTDFDKTTLEEAERQGLITTPEHPGALTEQNDKKSRTSLFIGGGAVALVAVGLGYFMGQDSDSERRQPLVPAVMEDVIDEDTTTTTTTEQPTTTTTEAIVRTETSAAVERRNGDVVELPLITDEDIASGQAAYTLKEAASLFLTTGNRAFLEEFVDTNQAVQGVEGWQEIRDDLQMEDSSLFSEGFVLRFDTSDMEVEVLSVTDSLAQIRISGGLFIHEISGVEKWEDIEFYDYTVMNSAIDPTQVLTAHFEKTGGYWLFTGYSEG